MSRVGNDVRTFCDIESHLKPLITDKKTQLSRNSEIDELSKADKSYCQVLNANDK